MIPACLASMRSSLFSNKSSGDNRMLLVIAAISCAVLPLDLTQLPFLLVGAIAYALLMPHKAGQRTKFASKKLKEDEGPANYWGGEYASHKKQNRSEIRCGHHESRRTKELERNHNRTTTAAPVITPTFSSNDFNAQVQELLNQLVPSPESDAAVKRLARAVQKVLRPLLPEVEVVGFASGDITRGKAFGVAVPDVEILVQTDEKALAKRLQGRMQSQATTDLDAHKLLKSSIRTCTDRLVGQGGMKFRRSAFKEKEPKVTLLAPASLVFDQAIAFDLTVNATTPAYHAELVAESERIDPRAKALILLVKRWAKDRGVCHAPKGHLSPYLWSMLVIYFLQVNDEAGAILPALDGFKLSPNLLRKIGIAEPAKTSASWQPATSSSNASVTQLFKQFFNFYANKFEWKKEAISIRMAVRAAPDQALPVHIMVHDDGKTEVGPSIEDPCSIATNLGSCFNAASFARLSTELARAHEICAADTANLGELLQLWVPADAQADSKGEE